MKILLLQPPFEDFYATSIRLYPLGLLYAAEVLKSAGCAVEILDCLVPLRKRQAPVPEDFSHLRPYLGNPYFFKGYYRFGLTDGEIAREIKDSAPDLIGVSSQFTAYYQSVERLARWIKANFKTAVFIGGHHATAFARDIERRTPEIDAVLAGPAEKCLPEFLAKRGAVSKNESIDWTSLQPSHHLLAGPNYRIGRKNYISLTASRGCPFSCDFCSVRRLFGRRILYRRAGSIMEEMRSAYEQRNVRIFNFEDDNLSYDRTWFLEFLAAVKNDPLLKGIELTAMNGLCAGMLDEDILAQMAAAGFKRINLSLVSRSGKIRSDHHRPPKRVDFERLVRTAKALKLFVTVYVIIGLPGQTYAEIKDSLDDLWGLGVLVGPSVFYMPPASPLFDYLSLPPAVRENWNLYRSSAFAVETEHLGRAQLIDLFLYARRKNLENKIKIM